jgi:acetyl-CoA synthetase
VERANVTRLMRAHGIATEEELVERSTSDVEWFWDAAIRDLGLEFYEPYASILDTSRGVEWATWFGGGSVNLAHLRRPAERTPDATASWEGERHPRHVVREPARPRPAANGPPLASEARRGRDLPAADAGGGPVMAREARAVAAAVPARSRRGREAAGTLRRRPITADGLRRGKVVPMKETADEAW